MNTGGRGGGRGGAQTKTSHKIFLLEKHKVLSFFFFIYLVDTFTFSAGSVNRIIFGNNLIKIYPAPNMALLGEGKGKNKIFPMTYTLHNSKNVYDLAMGKTSCIFLSVKYGQYFFV